MSMINKERNPEALSDFQRELIADNTKEAGRNNNQQNQTEKKEVAEEKSDFGKIDLYAGDKLPTEAVKTTQMKILDLCELISSQFRGIFKDYAGATFRPMPNGELEFLLLFKPIPKDGAYPYPNSPFVAFEAPDMSGINPTAQMIQLFSRNSQGRIKYNITEPAMDFFNHFMIRKRKRNGELEPVNYNQCIEYREVNTAHNFIYNSAPHMETFLLLRNVDVSAIISALWTSPEQKAKDKEKNEKFKSAHKNFNGDLSRYQYVLVFKGYRHEGFAGYSRVQPPTFTVDSYGVYRQVPNASFSLRDYYVNIEKIDVEEVNKLVPRSQILNADWFMQNVR